MEPVGRIAGVVAPLDRPNVDTDQIIPKQFLKRIERTGYAPFLFYDWRYLDDGTTENPDFELNRAPWRDAPVLLTGRNFGCGSSREHAVWALQQYGVRAVIAASFSDIFTSNALKCGLLPVVLPEPVVERWLSLAQEEPGLRAVVDLDEQYVELAGERQPLAIDAAVRDRLLGGWDDIALSLRHDAEITAYEAGRPAWLPRATGLGPAQ